MKGELLWMHYRQENIRKQKKRYMKKIFLLGILGCLFAFQQAFAQTDSIGDTHELKNVVVKATNGVKAKSRVDNTELIGKGQLIRAACCNLGESFTANPSVDVSYSDAATGAKQIKLLGLSGTYVQMLTENVPNLRGASLPYSLGYVPGPWMQSIQVSKGASSVKNGYESTTGQINIEFLKPQGTDGVRANVYQDSELKTEANLDGSIHLNDRLSTATLLHFENRQMDHDGNGDGFMDMPKLRQYNIMHRWAYVSPGWISQLMLHGLHDEHDGGQSAKHTDSAPSEPRYTTSVRTNRYEMQWKNGFTLDAEHNTSIALMLHGSWHDADNSFGQTQYDVVQKNGYAQLMFETDFSENHNMSVGASFNHDHYAERFNPHGSLPDAPREVARETTPGLYAHSSHAGSTATRTRPFITICSRASARTITNGTFAVTVACAASRTTGARIPSRHLTFLYYRDGPVIDLALSFFLFPHMFLADNGYLC